MNAKNTNGEGLSTNTAVLNMRDVKNHSVEQPSFLCNSLIRVIRRNKK